jgi:hypothetical protein
MKAKDLRIGNIVYYDDKHIDEIDGIDISTMDNSDEYLANHKPIPLTPEWLIKLGFSGAFHKLTGEHSHLPSHYNLNGFRIDVEYNCGSEEVSHYEFNLHPSTELKYVHQLQNLFFSLTGTELEIKEEHSTCG